MKKRNQSAFGVIFRNWDRKKCTLTAEALQELPRRWELNIIAIAMKMAVEYAFAQLIVRSSVDHQLFGLMMPDEDGSPMGTMKASFMG